MTSEIRVDPDGQRADADRAVATIAAFETLEAVLDVEAEGGLVLLHGALDLTSSPLAAFFDAVRSLAFATRLATPFSFAAPAVTSESGAIVSSGLATTAALGQSWPPNERSQLPALNERRPTEPQSRGIALFGSAGIASALIYSALAVNTCGLFFADYHRDGDVALPAPDCLAWDYTAAVMFRKYEAFVPIHAQSVAGSARQAVLSATVGFGRTRASSVARHVLPCARDRSRDVVTDKSMVPRDR